MRSKIVPIVAFSIALGWITPPVSAEMDAKAIQVVGRVLGFVQNMPIGQQTVAIIYDPGSAVSKQEADNLVALMAGGIAVGKFSLSAKLVAVSNLGEIAGSKLAIVTEGLAGHHAEIFSSTSSQSILTISADEACVSSGNCVLGVSTSPKVEITLNAAAGRNSSIEFAQALRMLVREV